MTSYDEKQICAALDRLVHAGTLTADQAAAVQAGLAAAPPPRDDEGLAARGLAIATLAAAYVGVGLIVAAVGTLIGQNWDDMSVLGRTLAYGAITVVLVVAGWVLRGRVETGRGLAWLVAVGSGGATGAALLSGEGMDDATPFLAAGIAALVVGIPLLVLRPAAPQAIAVVGGLLTTTLAACALLDFEALGFGSALWVLGVLVAVAALAGILPVRLFTAGLGGLIALLGLHVVASESLGLCAALALLLAAAAYTLSVREEPAIPLTVATLTVATAGPRILGEWLHGSIGAAGVLALSGVVVLAAAATHVRLVRRRDDRATA